MAGSGSIAESGSHVVVVGGGVTGLGVARDLAMRRAAVTVVERGSLSSGTTGRMHGLLHSGARYAVSDPESARQCIRENETLRDIASHCVEDTGGLFVSLAGDDPEYFEEKREACESVGIPVEELSGAEALQREPGLTDDVQRALSVPDAAIDPFRLVAANAASAASHGARIETDTAVTDVLVEEGTVTGVLTEDESGETTVLDADHVVNAAGPWAGEIADMAGVPLQLRPSKGAMLVTNSRPVDTVINRCRAKTEGDILVPHESTAILGTTDRDVDDPEDFEQSAEEVKTLVDELQAMVPSLGSDRYLRAYWGVRPVFDPSPTDDPADRSRDYAVLDHAERDDRPGFTSVVGGKLTTYRLMAEDAADVVSEDLDVETGCRTAAEPLPGSEESVSLEAVLERYDLRSTVANRTTDRLGDRTDEVLSGETPNPVVCECEGVTRAEVRSALERGDLDVHDVRKRTRASMGTCQGAQCGHRIAGEISRLGGPAAGIDALEDLTRERWAGQRRVPSPEQLEQMALGYRIRMGALGGRPPAERSEGPPSAAFAGDSNTNDSAGGGGID
ncbi:MAG: anaerobic glycerol-3-phosphate dehydrogenase subunit GlpA [Halanaeroarchaeum sp.]